MNYNVNYYLCNTCAVQSGYLNHLSTGSLINLGYMKSPCHTGGSSTKPVNGVFYDKSTGRYQQMGRELSMSGFVEVEVGSGVNAYREYNSGIGYIENFGSRMGQTCLLKAVMITNSDRIKLYPATGYNGTPGICQNCGGTLSGVHPIVSGVR